MVTKAEMQDEHTRTIGLCQELSLRSVHLRTLQKLIIDEVVAYLSPKPPPLRDCWNLDDLIGNEPEETQKGIRRIFKRHGPARTAGKARKNGGRDRLVFWTPEGARARGSFDQGRENNFKLTQGVALWIGSFAVRKLNRDVPAKHLRDALRVSKSSWSNVVSSFHRDEVMGPYRLQAALWVGPNGEEKPTALMPCSPDEGLDGKVKKIFGDRLWGILGPEGFIEPPETIESLGFFFAEEPGG